MDIILLILQSLWFLLPAGFANMSPVLFNRINFLVYPVDFNKTLNDKPIFGQNKTFRGIFFGVIVGIVICYLQKLFYAPTSSIAIVDYTKINVFWLGFLLGLGALLGDLAKSFFKRQFNIPPGKSFIPFDQIDWILGSLFIGSIYIEFHSSFVIISFLLFGLLHPTINYVGYLLKLKKNKF